MTAGAQALAFKPAFVYVANRESDTLSAHAIDANTGVLKAVAGSPFPAGEAPRAISTHPSGRFVYVVNEVSSNISAYAVDATSGVLTAVDGSPFRSVPPLFSPTSITTDASGRFAYVTSRLANSTSNFALSFSINGTTGALTQIGLVDTGTTNTGAFSVAADPMGRFAYVANRDAHSVIAYQIARPGQGAEGTLLPSVQSSPFPVGMNPLSLGVDPSGRFLNAANWGSNTVSAFSIDGTRDMTRGALTAVGSPFAAGTNPVSFSTEPRGWFAYVANEVSQDVSAYRIDAHHRLLDTLVQAAPLPPVCFLRPSVPIQVAGSSMSLTTNRALSAPMQSNRPLAH